MANSGRSHAAVLLNCALLQAGGARRALKHDASLDCSLTQLELL